MKNLVVEKDKVQTKIKNLNEYINKCDIKQLKEIFNEKLKDISIKEDMIDKLQNCKESKEMKIVELTNKIQAYKTFKLDQKRNQLHREYMGIMEEIHSVIIGFDNTFYKNFIVAMEICKRTSRFKNLQQKIIKNIVKLKDNYKDFLINEVKENLRIPEKLHILSYALRKLISYEFFFNEQVFSSILYEDIKKSVYFHFFSNKKTNRLDKPEWLFDYILERLNELESVLNLYSEFFDISAADIKIKNENNIYMEYFFNEMKANYEESSVYKTENSFKKIEFGIYSVKKSFCEKIFTIIEDKFNEILSRESEQKHDLILNFALKLISFRKKIELQHDVAMSAKKISNSIVEIEKNKINIKMENIHLSNYNKWFSEYRKLYKSAIENLLPLIYLDEMIFLIIMQHITDNILLYNDVFIKQMRFCSQDELELLCNIYSELEDIKIFLSEQEDQVLNAFSSESKKLCSEETKKRNIYLQKPQ
ncbi:hypothetical protein EDEG_01818 [Edhazardia aedis USNM 41457]|uniref:Uncharacterized protein n=1 Tax=Edhazardia aedis (strain USNM 41457) TaxID=1003232 RepID=J9DMU4_EDHAE|nr:hypothetical protein EDEG_01818 [Edhazardia aedis USNM 41457]|eukprot:EJW03890.1 hypothetical protein EDEG_01818 [Edhazardia aedis USNM 41457]